MGRIGSRKLPSVTAHGLLVAAVVLPGVLVFGPSPRAEQAPPGACGTTTLEATVQDLDGNGILGCGPGDELVVRDGLAPPARGRAPGREHLISFFLLADFQLADEELTLPSRTDWRPHPALIPHMLNAQLSAASAVAAEGGPVLGGRFDMAFAVGDLADNAQLNETRLVIDMMDGNQLVDPGSGADGYHGQKRDDPKGAGDLASPVPGRRILDLANEPFWAAGLRNADGSPIPWYAVHGNHDSKVMGGIPHDDPEWRAIADEWATGDRKIFSLNPDLEAEIARIREHSLHEEAAFWRRTFELAHERPSEVGDVRTVPADAARRLLSKTEWMQEFRETTGRPRGHGFSPDSQLCPDVYGDDHSRRACYAFDHGKFRFIALDDNALEGYTAGSIDRHQFRWLEEHLISSSSEYFGSDGSVVANPDGTDRYVVVLSHHTSRGMDSRGTHGQPFNEFRGEHLRELLLRFPNVILHANGHSHSNRLWPHADAARGTQYWEVNTSSVADHPHSGRTIEIAANGDGTLSIFGVLFELGMNPDPRKIDWATDDPTDETRLASEPRAVNEHWLAAAGAEEAFTQARQPRYGAPEDRNVEMTLPDPLWSPVTEAVSRPPVSAARLTSGNTGAVAGLVLAVAVVIWYMRRRRARRPAPDPPAPSRRENVRLRDG